MRAAHISTLHQRHKRDSKKTSNRFVCSTTYTLMLCNRRSIVCQENAWHSHACIEYERLLAQTSIGRGIGIFEIKGIQAPLNSQHTLHNQTIISYCTAFRLPSIRIALCLLETTDRVCKKRYHNFRISCIHGCKQSAGLY